MTVCVWHFLSHHRRGHLHLPPARRPSEASALSAGDCLRCEWMSKIALDATASHTYRTCHTEPIVSRRHSFDTPNAWPLIAGAARHPQQ
jgi:hypothetical protein